MKPLVDVWPYALLFWATFIWAFAPEFAILRRAQVGQAQAKDPSLRILMVGQAFAYFAGFMVASIPTFAFARMTHLYLAFWSGWVLLVCGSLLRRHCWRMLGSSFTGEVRARPDQTVVDRGAYRILRHPSYTAGLLLCIGVGVTLGNWISVAILAALPTAAYVHRMNVEEQTLLATIGEPYRRFMGTRKRLLPFIY